MLGLRGPSIGCGALPKRSHDGLFEIPNRELSHPGTIGRVMGMKRIGREMRPGDPPGNAHGQPDPPGNAHGQPDESERADGRYGIC